MCERQKIIGDDPGGWYCEMEKIVMLLFIVINKNTVEIQNIFSSRLGLPNVEKHHYSEGSRVFIGVYMQWLD